MHYDLDPIWYRPRTVEEALLILEENRNENIHILAGGTDLNVRIRDGQLIPEHIVDITGIDELSSISIVKSRDINNLENDNNKDYVFIGAAATMDDICRSSITKAYLPSLVKAAGEVGSPLIRNVATMGGNIMNASPAADMATMLYALDAMVILAKRGEERLVPIEKIFTGVCATCAEQHELLTSILIPCRLPFTGTGFFKLKRREALSLSIVNSSAMLRSDGERITGSALAVGAVAVTPLMISESKEILMGINIHEVEKFFPEVAELARDSSRPITDVRGSEEYRKEMVRACAFKVLREAFVALKRDIHMNREEVD